MTTVPVETYDNGVLVATGTVTVPAEVTNERTLRDLAAAAFTANRTDITQAEAISTQAAALAATTGNFTLTQASTHIRSLATAVKVLADHDVTTKRQLNGAMRLVLQQFDGTD